MSFQQPQSTQDILNLAKNLKPRTLVVAAAETESALHAAIEARKAGLARTILVGDAENLKKMLVQEHENASDYEILHEPDDKLAAARSVALVREKHAHIILKGRLKTGDLMKAVLDKEKGLRRDALLSDVLVSENPMSETPRLLGLSDGGLNVAPDLNAKKNIIINAVRVFQRLGYTSPNVALLCALEQPTEAMPHTLEAQKLTEMAERGEISGCKVYGPLALDNALWSLAAQYKGIHHPVAGNADILIVPTIEAGNMLGKAFTYFAKKPVGHVVEGARAPILIPSRVESAKDKLISIALGIICAQDEE